MNFYKALAEYILYHIGMEMMYNPVVIEAALKIKELIE